LVFQFNVRYWNRISTLAISLILAISVYSNSVSASEQEAAEALRVSDRWFDSGHYFKSARYAFQAAQLSKAKDGEAYYKTTRGLMRAGLYHSASYFYIRTLTTKNRTAIRSVLTYTETLIQHVGVDLIRRQLAKYTTQADYTDNSKNAYLYAIGKAALLKADYEKAARYFSGISPSSSVYPNSLQMRATAFAIMNQSDNAVDDFKDCADRAEQLVSKYQGHDKSKSAVWIETQKQQAIDLHERCTAGVARSYYQMNKFKEADEYYTKIDKSSFVWTDILFEQAWTYFSVKDYNRALGKLVTYKSPMLGFIHNSEVDVLRAQSYLALCLYGDARLVMEEFSSKYGELAKDIKRFVESNKNLLKPFYEKGKVVLANPLHKADNEGRLINRFIRSAYFRNLVASESSVASEEVAVARFGASLTGATGDPRKGFPGFLQNVLSWRKKSIAQLGGAYVKNSLIDYHRVLISDFEKMDFIKLEMLRLAKEQLMDETPRVEGRKRGAVTSDRLSNQYWWSFNGEFWIDELGDYVFGLKSECS